MGEANTCVEMCVFYGDVCVFSGHASMFITMQFGKFVEAIYQNQKTAFQAEIRFWHLIFTTFYIFFFTGLLNKW